MASKTQLTGKHNYVEFKEQAIVERVRKMVAMRDSLDASKLRVKFSYGNRKTGRLVTSVSLIPVADCGNCSMCARGCYDVRNVCYTATSQMQRANNSAIYKADPVEFMRQVEEEIRFSSFFRFFVGGDLKEPAMLTAMVAIAERQKTCQILMFTKMYDIVNGYLDDHPEGFPSNLHIILSGWRGDKDVNRHNLPVSSPVWKDGERSCMVTGRVHWCEGNCTVCAITGQGCWVAGKGDTILFEAH